MSPGNSTPHLGVVNEALAGARVGGELAGACHLEALDDSLQAGRQTGR